MIPKIFHQIWLGPKPIPDNYNLYRQTWLEKNNNWCTILWNENNITSLTYFKKDDFEKCVNYSEKSDYLRFCIVLEHWGVYLDIDFECLQPIDLLISPYDFFIWKESAGDGREFLNSAIFWATPHHIILKKIFTDIPHQLNKIELNNVYKIWPGYVSSHEKYILEEGGCIFPKYYFDPISWEDYFPWIELNRKELIEKGAYGIHHYYSSWHPLRLKIIAPIRKWYLWRLMLKIYRRIKYFLLNIR